MTQIPEDIALQGEKVINEYIDLKKRYKTYRSRCHDIAISLRDVGKEMNKLLLSSQLVSSQLVSFVSENYDDFIKANPLEKAVRLEGLCEEYADFSIEYRECDAMQLELIGKMKEKGWDRY